MKKGYFGHIEDLTKENTDFRHVLYTGTHMQLVLMSLLPGEDIGSEVHEENDQFFRFDAGQGKVVVGETEYEVTDGDALQHTEQSHGGKVETREEVDEQAERVEHRRAPGGLHQDGAA